MGDQRPTVLACVDGSASSYRAGAWAVHLAQLQRAQLIGLFVHTPFRLFAGTVPGADAAAYELTAETAAELKTLAYTRAEFLELEMQFVERRGDPYTEIISLAREHQTDHIVVGASEQPRHRVAGSLAVRLVRNGTWPVTVVP